MAKLTVEIDFDPNDETTITHARYALERLAKAIEALGVIPCGHTALYPHGAEASRSMPAGKAVGVAWVEEGSDTVPLS